MTPARFVDTPEALAEVCRLVAGESAIALDTEFVREKSYVPRLELVQLATRAGDVAIVDVGTIGVEAAGALGEMLRGPALKVFHAAEQDLEMLALVAGDAPGPIWDTQIAAPLFGYTGRTGYAGMVEALLGRRPRSGEAYTDWSRRPLSPDQLRYAAEDVRHLFPLHDAERERLEKLGRLDWAAEEFEALRQKVRGLVAHRIDERTLHQRIKGWQKLNRRGLAILRELAVWRERIAASRNRPAPTVLRDDLLIEIARRAPASVDELRIFRGLHGRDVERFGDELVGAVAAGRAVPREQWPELPPPAELGDAEGSLVALLHAVLQAVAREKEVAPTIVAASADLQRLVLAHGEGAALDDLRVLSGWRGELVGRELLAVLRGEHVVAWDPERRTVRLGERSWKAPSPPRGGGEGPG
jgi:ribonuclease D